MADTNGATPHQNDDRTPVQFTDAERAEFRRMVEAGRREWLEETGGTWPQPPHEYSTDDLAKLAEIGERMLETQRRLDALFKQAEQFKKP